MRSRPRPYVSSDQAIILDATANHIEKVLDHYSDFGFATDWEPAAGCPLHSEGDRLKRQYGPGTTHTERRWTGTELLTRTVPVARYWDSAASDYASESCLLLTSLAGQYLEGLRLLLRDREVLFAPTPIARSVFEIAGYVFWLLDPDVKSVRDRAARAMLAQLSDATRHKTAAVRLGHPNAPRLGKSVHRLRKEEIPALFFPSEIQEIGAPDPHLKAGGRTATRFRLRQQSQPGLEASLKFITKATESAWNTAGMYAYLSNATHPTPHVVYEALHRDAAGRVVGFAYEDASLPYRITRLAVLSFVLSWRISAAYRGLDQTLPQQLSVEMDTLPSL